MAVPENKSSNEISVAWQGGVLKLTSSLVEGVITFQANEYHFDFDSVEFLPSKTTSMSLELISEGLLKPVLWNVVKSLKTGQDILCVVFMNTDVHSQCHIIQYENNQLHASLGPMAENLLCLSDFSCDQNFNYDQNLKIIDGPMLIYIDKDHTLCCFKFDSSGSLRNTTNCPSVRSLLWCDCRWFDGNTIVIVLAKTMKQLDKNTMSDCDENNIDVDCDSQEEKLVLLTFYPDTEKTVLRVEKYVSDFVPEIYTIVISCIKVLNFLLRKSGVCDELRFETHLLLCTISGQLIEFKNGRLQRFLNTDKKNVEEVKLAETEGGEYHMTLKCDSGITVVSWKTFQVVYTYPQFTCVLVNDFLGYGFEQLLFSTNQDPVCHFLLTDYHRYHQDSSEVPDRALEDHGNTNEHLQTAIHAMERRLQDGLRSLAQAERRLLQKQKLIQQTCAALRKMNLGQETREDSDILFEPSLVPLIRSNQDEDNSVITSSSSTCQYSPSADTAGVTSSSGGPYRPLAGLASSLWHHVVDDTLAIGIDLTESSYSNLSLSLIPNGHHGNGITESRCLPGPLNVSANSGSDISPPRKRRKADSSFDNQIIAVTDLPVFGLSDHVTYTVLCHWSERDTEKGNRNLARQDNPSNIDVIGEVTLTLKDLHRILRLPSSASSVKDASVAKHELCLNAIQLQTALTMRSSCSDLSKLPIILKKMSFNEDLICVQHGVFYLVRVSIMVLQRHTADVIVFTRDSRQLLLFVHTLYSELPDDVIIIPLLPSNQAVTIAATVKALSNEVNCISNGFRQMIKDAEAGRNTDKIASDDLSDVQEIRKQFVARQQEIHMHDKSRTVDKEKFANILNQIYKLQIDTDLSVSDMAKKMSTYQHVHL